MSYHATSGFFTDLFAPGTSQIADQHTTDVAAAKAQDQRDAAASPPGFSFPKAPKAPPAPAPPAPGGSNKETPGDAFLRVLPFAALLGIVGVGIYFSRKST